MITVKFSTLVDPVFNVALSHLKAQTKLPMLFVKRLDKILEVLQRELERYSKDVEEQRKGVFGELTEAQRDLLVNFEKPGLEERFRSHGYTAEQEADFRAKFKQVDEYCEELGKEEIKVPVEKLKLPDSFEIAYNHAKSLADILNLE